MSDPYRILSFDGGGVKGVLSACVLGRLIAYRPKLLSRVDLFSGTSTGGLIALLLASGNDPDQVLERYIDQTKKVFTQSWLRKAYSGFGLTKSKYGSKNIDRVLQEEFGDLNLTDLPNKVLVTSTDLKTNKSQRFGLHPFTNLVDNKTRVWEAARCTTAAPTFFPSHKGYVDGAMMANNPSAAAIEASLSYEDIEISDLLVLNIGTGVPASRYIDGEELDWGILNWISRFMDIYMYLSVYSVDRQLETYLPNQYKKITVDLFSRIDIDDINMIPELIRIAEGIDISSTVKWLEENEW